MLQGVRNERDLVAEQVALEAEVCRRQAQVLGSKEFARGFAEALVAWKRGDKLTHSKDLNRKYA